MCFAVADSQDVDLDAILGELCALESQYDEALAATATIPNPAKPGQYYGLTIILYFSGQELIYKMFTT